MALPLHRPGPPFATWHRASSWMPARRSASRQKQVLRRLHVGEPPMMRSGSNLTRFLLLLGLLALPGLALAADLVEPDAESSAEADDDRGRPVTVGDGTPASCTEMALRH